MKFGRCLGVVSKLISFLASFARPEQEVSLVNRTKVKSSQIDSIGYNVDAQVLEIAFHARKDPGFVMVYQYDEFPEIGFADLMAAESKGKYLNRVIKPDWGTRTRKVGLQPIQPEGEPTDTSDQENGAKKPSAQAEDLQDWFANLVAKNPIPDDFFYKERLELRQNFNSTKGRNVVAHLTLVVESESSEG